VENLCLDSITNIGRHSLSFGFLLHVLEEVINRDVLLAAVAAFPGSKAPRGALLRLRDGTPTAYLRQQVERLTKARDDLAARRDADKQRYEDDVKLIDRLIHQEKFADTTDLQDEVSGVESELVLLKTEEGIFEKNQDSRVNGVITEEEGLRNIRSTLGNATSFKYLIPSVTKEGEAFYQEAQVLDKEVQQLDGELKSMERKLMDAEEKEDGEAGVLDSMEDGDEEESARSLESALGWHEDELEKKATNAENALNAAIGHKPVMGAMMGAMMR